MFKNTLNLFQKCRFGVTLTRVNDVQFKNLYSQAALGIDNYVRNRERIQGQFTNMLDTFKSKMSDFVVPSSMNMIFTEDLKNMIHVAESNSHDIDLVVKMMIKFNKQNKDLRFGSFVFGPVVMRMFHYLDDPNTALQCFLDPELAGFFDQVSSYQILMDLLLEHDRYEDILKVYDHVKKQQIQGLRHPKNIVVLVCAACYKKNTEESFKYACEFWAELISVGHQPMRRAATFVASLALNHNNPNVALEVLSNTKQQNYMTVRNLKAVALAQLGRHEDALGLLRSVVNTDSTLDKKGTFAKDSIEKISMIIKSTNNKDLVNEFTSIEKYLIENGHLTDDSLHDLLNSEIALVQQNLNRNAMYQHNIKMQNYYKGNSGNYNKFNNNKLRRPGITDMY